MTPEQHREYAAEIMRDQAHHWDQAAISDRLGLAGGRFAARDVDAIIALICTADIEITWPDPCPACGVIGCTQHPTWTAEKVVPCQSQYAPGGPGSETVECGLPDGHPTSHRSVHTGVVWADDPAEWAPWPGDGPNALDAAGLTPAQEIRLRLVESLTNERTEVDEPYGIIDMAAQFAAFVETGQRPDLEDACAERCPNAEQHAPHEVENMRGQIENMRGQLVDAYAHGAMAQTRLDRVAKVLDEIGMALPASDAAQLRAALEWVPAAEFVVTPSRAPAQTVSTAATIQTWTEVFQREAELVPPTRAGYSETLRVPGTDEAVVLTSDGFEPVVTAADPGGLLNDSGTPPEADEPVKQTAHPHSDTQTGSTALHGPAPLGGTANVADGETP